MLNENRLVGFGELGGPDMDKFVRVVGFGGLDMNKLVRFVGPNVDDLARFVAIGRVDVNKLVGGSGLSGCDVHRTVFRPELECATNMAEALEARVVYNDVVILVI